MIPRLIHQTWRDAHPPEELARLRRTWKARNPHWQYRLWTDADNRRLVADRAPWFLARYDAYPEPIMRVDAFRYFLMFAWGVFTSTWTSSVCGPSTTSSTVRMRFWR